MQIDKRLKAELDKTGLPWLVETGGIHFKVKLAGRLVCVFPKGKKQEGNKRVVLNTIAQVRRTAKEVRGAS